MIKLKLSLRNILTGMASSTLMLLVCIQLIWREYNLSNIMYYQAMVLYAISIILCVAAFICGMIVISIVRPQKDDEEDLREYA